MFDEAQEAAGGGTKVAAHHIEQRTGVRISPRTLEGYRRCGTGPRFMRIAGKVTYRFSDIDGWLDSCLVEPAGRDAEPGIGGGGGDGA